MNAPTPYLPPTTHRTIFGAAAERSAHLADHSVDLVVTSPPYPMIAMWDDSFSAVDPSVATAIADGDGSAAFKAMHRILDAVWAECYRVLRPGGFACINIGDATRTLGDSFRLYTNHTRITGACERLGFQSLPAVLWRKATNAPNKFMGAGTLPAGAYVTLEHEHILIFRKGDRRVFSGAARHQRRESAFFWEERNAWFSDLWELSGVRQALPHRESRLRSGAYPVEIPFRLINMYSVRGDTILDPFSGTGTTMLAALASGRNSVNIELDTTLEPVVDRTVDGALPSLNERQCQRLADHRTFVEGYTAQRDAPPQHWNTRYDVAVVTRQETDLVLHTVERVERNDDGFLTATYRPME